MLNESADQNTCSKCGFYYDTPNHYYACLNNEAPEGKKISDKWMKRFVDNFHAMYVCTLVKVTCVRCSGEDSQVLVPEGDVVSNRSTRQRAATEFAKRGWTVNANGHPLCADCNVKTIMNERK